MIASACVEWEKDWNHTLDYPRRREHHRISASQIALTTKQATSPYLPLLTSTTRIAFTEAQAVKVAT